MTPIYLQYLPLFTATLFGVCLWGVSVLSTAHGRRWLLPLVALALALTVFQPDAHWRDNRKRIADRVPAALHKVYRIEGPQDVIRRLDHLPEFGLTGRQVWFDGPIEARLEALGYRAEPGPLNTRLWGRPDLVF